MTQKQVACKDPREQARVFAVTLDRPFTTADFISICDEIGKKTAFNAHLMMGLLCGFACTQKNNASPHQVFCAFFRLPTDTLCRLAFPGLACDYPYTMMEKWRAAMDAPTELVGFKCNREARNQAVVYAVKPHLKWSDDPSQHTFFVDSGKSTVGPAETQELFSALKAAFKNRGFVVSDPLPVS